MSWKWSQTDALRLWLRKKNFAIFLFLLLYILARLVLYLKDHFVGVFESIPREILLVLSGLPAVFITLFMANIIIRIIGPFISRYFRDELEVEERIFFAKVVELVVYILAVAFILYSFGVQPSSIALIAGFLTGGLAFALREPVLSFIVWLVILNKRPFRIGDTIRINEYEGKVDRIGTFYLTLNPTNKLRVEGEAAEHTLKVPNRLLIENNIENYGKKLVRHIIRLEIRTRPRSVTKLMNETKKTVARVLKRNQLPQDVEIGTDVAIDRPHDRQYVVVTVSLPIDRKEALRSEILTAVYEKHRTVFIAP